MPRTEMIAVLLFALLSAVLVVAGYRELMPITEVLGFITGAAGVYLTVKRSIWNFPVGLANNLFLGLLFFKARLYNDTGLQVVYFVLGLWGWWVWSHASSQNEALAVGRANATQLLGCCLFIPVATAVLTKISQNHGGAAPFWDALTTSICLAAQYLLGRKWLENWAFWIVADLIYVPLYISRGLWLTAGLYLGFLGLCIMGVLSWKRQLEVQNGLEDGRNHR